MEFLYFLEKLRAPWLDTLMELITRLGGETLFLAAALILYWCVDKYKGYYLLCVGFTGTVLNQFLKLLCRIPRPWVINPGFTIVESARAGATGYSFPSGHTQAAASVYGSLARLSRKKWLSALLWGVFALVAFSRMYLGVHTPWDVLAAAALALALIFGLYPLFRDIKDHPARLYAVLLAQCALALGFVLYTALCRFPADMDPANLAEGVKNAWTLLGASAGMLLSIAIDRRLIHFRERAPLPAQIVKTLLGLCLTVLLRALLKAPLNALTGGHPCADALRYFMVVVFAAAAWPAAFTPVARLLEKNKE